MVVAGMGLGIDLGIDLTALLFTGIDLVVPSAMGTELTILSDTDIGFIVLSAIGITLVLPMFSSIVLPMLSSIADSEKADSENPSGNVSVSLCRRFNSFIMLLLSFALWV